MIVFLRSGAPLPTNAANATPPVFPVMVQLVKKPPPRLRPAPSGALLPLTVVLKMEIAPPSIPPPLVAATLLLMVLPESVRLPPRIPPPRPVAGPVWFPSMVLLVIVTVPARSRPPPEPSLGFGPPPAFPAKLLLTVTFENVSVLVD